MRRVADTTALVLLLAAPMGSTLYVGWTEYAQRAGLVALMDGLRRSDCRPPHCIACPRPQRSIHWPSECHARKAPAPR